MQVVGNNMVMSSLNLSDEDQAVLRFMREHDGTPDRKEIQQGLRKAGYAITDKDVRQSLESMRERGYVEEHDSTPKTFSLSAFAPITEFKVDLDYAKIAEAAATEVYNIPGVPESVADEYVRRFCEGDGLKTVHPFTGELVDITEDTSLQDAMNEATQDIADIFDTPFGKPASDENAAGEGQSELGAVSDGGLNEFPDNDAPIDDDADEGTLV
jgi:Fe2+ or Zn2+ uptake regulation protein